MSLHTDHEHIDVDCSAESYTRDVQTQARLECGRQAGNLLLRMTGEDPIREGLRDTPIRMAKAFDFLTSGYRLSVNEAVGHGIFPAEGTGLVSVNHVEFFSMCEHHMLPFLGHASVAYFPNKKILGLSKIPRLINLFARRVQVQERLTQQICDAIIETIAPRAVMVKVEAAHMCMMMRGVEKVSSKTTTETYSGLENLLPHEREQILKTTV